MTDSPTTIAALGPRAASIARTLADDGAFTLAAVADSLPQLLLDRGFPARILLVDEAPDPDCTRARIAVGRSFGARIVLVRDGRAARRAARTASEADHVVASDVDRDTLHHLLGAPVAPRVAAPSARRFTAREQEALNLWSRYQSVATIAHEMQVSSATASTFLWRARRKLREAPAR